MTNIEGTPGQQRRFDASMSRVVPDIQGRDVRITPPESREQFMARHIMQQLIADSNYPMNAPTLEDAVWWEAHELEEQNGLPTNVTAEAIHRAFLEMGEGE
jgi:hypothetical protein